MQEIKNKEAFQMCSRLDLVRNRLQSSVFQSKLRRLHSDLLRYLLELIFLFLWLYLISLGKLSKLYFNVSRLFLCSEKPWNWKWKRLNTNKTQNISNLILLACQLETYSSNNDGGSGWERAMIDLVYRLPSYLTEAKNCFLLCL